MTRIDPADGELRRAFYQGPLDVASYQIAHRMHRRIANFFRCWRARPNSNKAGILLRINDLDSETHQTHKDCDKYILMR